MEILTHRNVYQIVGDQTSGDNECITKSQALAIAEQYRKSVTSNLTLYLDNEYIDIFEVTDKEDLSKLVFTTKVFNPNASAATLSTSATSLNIDGETITYTATADVDWITDIVVANDNTITFKVAANSGDQRVGYITGVNTANKTDKITVTQEAYEAPLKYTYTLIMNNATSTPTVTINGQNVAVTSSDGVYTAQYIKRVAIESDAPTTLPFTVNGGGTSVSISNQSISVSPSSWDLKNSTSNTFTVTYSQDKTTVAWDKESGSIGRDASVTVNLKTSTVTETPTIEYSISDNAPDGTSYTYVKDDMSFKATPSSTDCAPSTITVSYGDASATVDVIYTPTVYTLAWSDGSSAVSKATGITATTFTDTVKGTMDGEDYTPIVTATSNQSWLTVTVSGTTVTINCTANDGSDNRTGVVTVTDEHQNSITYTVIQGSNVWAHTYTLVATSTGDTPTMTINGQAVTPTKSGDAYTGVYTLSGTGTDTAPTSVAWTISGGIPANVNGDCHVTVSPTEWNLEDSLSKTFTVTATQDITTYSWAVTSGTVKVDGSSSTYIDSATNSIACDYTVSCPGSMTSTKTDSGFSATATSTSNTGTITVTAGNTSANVNVVYEQSDYLIWQSSIEPTSVQFDYSGGSKTVTMYTWQQYAISGEIYGTKNSYTETITCSELQSESSRSWTEQFTHDGCTNKVACTQTANYKSWSSSISPSSMSFTWEGGTKTATMKTWWWWAGSDTQHHDESSYTCTVTVSQNENGGSGRETFTHDGQTEVVTWSQSARPSETWGSWIYVFSGTPGDVSYSWDCVKGSTASDDIESYRYRTSSWGNTDREDVSYSESSGTGPTSNNTTESSKTGTYSTLTQTNSGKTLTRNWVQEGKPEETFGDWTYEFYFAGGNTSASKTFDWDETGSDWAPAVVSKKTRTGSQGTKQEEVVSYTGTITGPTTTNTTGADRSDSGTLTQDESGKTLNWSWTQTLKPVTYGEYYLRLHAQNGSGEGIITSENVSSTRTSGGTWITFMDMDMDPTASSQNTSSYIESYREVYDTYNNMTHEEVACTSSGSTPSSNNTSHAITGTDTWTQAISGKTISHTVTVEAATVIQVSVSVTADTHDDREDYGTVTVELSNTVPCAVTVSGTVRGTNSTTGSYIEVDYSVTVPANSSSATTDVAYGETMTSSPNAVVNSISPDSYSYNQMEKAPFTYYLYEIS